MKRVTGWVRHRDIATFFWAHQLFRTAWTDRLMPLITHLGGAVWCIVLSAILLLSPNELWHKAGKTLGISLIVSTLIVTACKKIRPRLRPYQALPGVVTGRILMKDASFPSGHATAAFCKATILSSLLPQLALLFYAIATLIAYSRVYLGQHYPSDIAIGAFLGTVTATFFL